MKKTASFIILFLLISSPAMAINTGLEVSNYKIVSILFEGLGGDAKKIGLTDEAVKNKVELRIRSAGLERGKHASDDGYLYVNINVVGGAFNVKIEWARYIEYYNHNITICTTWDKFVTGTHGGSSHFIIETIDGLMDLFLNEYLKANVK